MEILVKFLETHAEAKAAVVGPKLFNFDGTLQYSCFRFYKLSTIFFRRTFLGRLKFAKKAIAKFLLIDKNIHAAVDPMEVDWLMGSAMMLNRRAMERVGFMDERFFMYFEDVDWCMRFWEAGFKVFYLPSAVFYHYHQKASFRFGVFDILLNKMTLVHIASAVKYFWKHRNYRSFN